MAFVAWAALCLVVVVALQRRPFVILVLVVLLWLAVPGIASARLTALGGLPFVHPAAILAIIAFVVLLVARPDWIGRAILDRPEWAVLLLTLSAIAVGVGIVAGAGMASVIAVVNQMVAPGVVFLLVGASLIERPGRTETLRTLLVVVAVLESLLALAQLAAGRSLVYQRAFSDLAIVRQGSDRWMGTLDHPLVLSLFLVVCLILLAGIHSSLAVGLAAPVILAGVLATQSRVGLFFSVLAVVYLLVRGRAAVAGRVAATVLLSTTALLAYAAGAGDALLERLRDDQGSTSARGVALDYFLGHVGEFVWIGRGLNGSFSVSEAAGLDSSFESAFLMYSVDLGVVVATVYFALMLWIAVRPLRRTSVVGLAPAAIAVILIPQTFSALSGTTAAPFIVWLVLGLAGFGPLRRSSTEALSPSLAVDLARARRPVPVTRR